MAEHEAELLYEVDGAVADARLAEYGVIVIWLGSGNQRLDFARFEFRIYVWGSVDAFGQNPRQGDLATFTTTSLCTTVPNPCASAFTV